MTLIETSASAAIVALAAGAMLFALGTFGRFGAHQTGPVHAAAAAAAEDTLRVAQDAWKYGTPGTAPSGTATETVLIAVPGAAATAVPVQVSTSLSAAGANGANIAVTVRYPPDSSHPGDTGTVTLTGAAAATAPLPGSQIVEPSAIPAPSGAP